MDHFEAKIPPYCPSLTGYSRRRSSQVRLGSIVIGGSNPVAVQTMTDTDTNDTEACADQIGKVYGAGGRIVRLTAQGVRESENLANIASRVRESYPGVVLIADIHFLPEAAAIAAGHVDKVRINPGNYNDKGGDFLALLAKCRERGTALRIGVNHGSLAERIVSRLGDTPQGMVASAMEFLEICRDEGFANVVVSMKSSNTRVMVQAYRLLAAEMAQAGMDYLIHLGVTEAGNGLEGRIKSAVGIGALLADGIGDTIRVSLTEPPENEIPVAQMLADHFAGREETEPCIPNTGEGICRAPLFNPYEYRRRSTETVGRLGGGKIPLLFSELDGREMQAVRTGAVAVLTAQGANPLGEWRRKLMEMDEATDRRPVILHRKYAETDPEKLAVKAAADFGVMFVDGLADAIRIENDPAAGCGIAEYSPGGCGQNQISPDMVDSIALDILQASRARMSKTDFIACPGCGRTLFDLQGTLNAVKARTGHLKDLKIAVMGCIVNGPGEMADADYGYVGAARGHISLYRGRELLVRNMPQESALEELVKLLKADGVWTEP